MGPVVGSVVQDDLYGLGPIWVNGSGFVGNDIRLYIGGIKAEILSQDEEIIKGTIPDVAEDAIYDIKVMTRVNDKTYYSNPFYVEIRVRPESVQTFGGLTIEEQESLADNVPDLSISSVSTSSSSPADSSSSSSLSSLSSLSSSSSPSSSSSSSESSTSSSSSSSESSQSTSSSSISSLSSLSSSSPTSQSSSSSSSPFESSSSSSILSSSSSQSSLTSESSISSLSISSLSSLSSPAILSSSSSGSSSTSSPNEDSSSSSLSSDNSSSSFSSHSSSYIYTDNLVNNWSFENGGSQPTDWIRVGALGAAGRVSNIKQCGSWSLRVWDFDGGTHYYYQNVDVSEWAEAIDSGGVYADINGYAYSANYNNNAVLYAYFYDETMTQLDVTSASATPTGGWRFLDIGADAPVGTRTIQIRCFTKNNSNGYFDCIKCYLIDKPDLSSSTQSSQSSQSSQLSESSQSSSSISSQSSESSSVSSLSSFSTSESSPSSLSSVSSGGDDESSSSSSSGEFLVDENGNLIVDENGNYIEIP